MLKTLPCTDALAPIVQHKLVLALPRPVLALWRQTAVACSLRESAKAGKRLDMEPGREAHHLMSLSSRWH